MASAKMKMASAEAPLAIATARMAIAEALRPRRQPLQICVELPQVVSTSCVNLPPDTRAGIQSFEYAFGTIGLRETSAAALMDLALAMGIGFTADPRRRLRFFFHSKRSVAQFRCV